jgi:hypothetical protein
MLSVCPSIKLSNQLTTETWYELNANGCPLKSVHLNLLQLLTTITLELFNRFSRHLVRILRHSM